MELPEDISSKYLQFKSQFDKKLDNSLAFIHKTMSKPYSNFLESMAGNAVIVKLSIESISKRSNALDSFQENLSDLVKYFQKLELSLESQAKKDGVVLEEIVEHNIDAFIETLDIAQSNLFEMYLVYVVSVFEAFVQNIHYEVFIKYPKTMSNGEVLEFSNSTELEKAAERLATKSTVGTPEDYLGLMIKRFGLGDNIISIFQPLSFIIEIRNLIVHTSGRVDERFLRRNPTSTLQKGVKIQITATNISELTETVRLCAEFIEMAVTNKFSAISQVSWSNEVEGWLMSILDLEGREKHERRRRN